jgi:hypothetical protein
MKNLSLVVLAAILIGAGPTTRPMNPIPDPISLDDGRTALDAELKLAKEKLSQNDLGFPTFGGRAEVIN